MTCGFRAFVPCVSFSNTAIPGANCKLILAGDEAEDLGATWIQWLQRVHRLRQDERWPQHTSDQSLDAGRKAWKHPGSIIPGSGQWCKPVVTVVELCSAVCHPCGVLDVASLSSGNMRRAIWLWNEDVCAEALGENELEVEIPKCNGKQLLCWMRLEELTIYWRLQMFSSSFIPFANLQSSKTSLERQGGWQFLFKV